MEIDLKNLEFGIFFILNHTSDETEWRLAIQSVRGIWPAVIHEPESRKNTVSN